MTLNWREYKNRFSSQLVYGSEPLSDGFIFEPIPYRSALKDNCSHILVLRTRPDGVTVAKRISFIEKLTNKRFFGRKLKLKHMMNWMQNQVRFLSIVS